MWLTAMLAIMYRGASIRQGGVTIALSDSSLASDSAAPKAALAPISIPAAADLSAHAALRSVRSGGPSPHMIFPFSASVVHCRRDIVSTVTSRADLVQPPWPQVHLSSGIARM